MMKHVLSGRMMTAKLTPDKREKALKVLTLMHESADSVRQACMAVGMAPSTFIEVKEQDAELRERYARAQADMIERMADKYLEIIDEVVPMLPNGGVDSGAVRDKQVRADARKWLLSKLAPRKYGDRVAVVGADDAPPIKTESTVNLSGLSDDVMAAILAAKDKTADAADQD